MTMIIFLPLLGFGDEEHENDIEVNDWIGLGSMDYYGISIPHVEVVFQQINDFVLKCLLFSHNFTIFLFRLFSP